MNETDIGDVRGLRGGSYGGQYQYYMSASIRNTIAPEDGSYGIGFRVAEGPEPATFSLLVTNQATVSYQWRLSGTNLPGANSSALTLTPTEARVARLAGDGLSTREVAAEMGISPRTVDTHLASLYGKLGVTSRAELGRVMALRETI